MKMNKKYVLLVSTIVSSWLFLSGCSNTPEAPSENIKLIDGAIAREENGKHTNYNLVEGKYSRLESEKAIVSYDKISGNYIYEKDEKIFIKYKEKDIELLDKNIINPKLSNGGEYFSFFKKDKYMQLVVKRLKDDKEIEIKSTVAISGDLMDWNNDTIIYYGVNQNKVNGIFAYNIEDEKEELIYELEGGYLEFLKCSKNGIIFLQQTLDNDKILKFINKNNDVESITEDILELKDVEITDKGIFVLGRMKDENYSIYEINDGEFNRIIYDFPNIIHMEKGLSHDEKGNILFIGSTDSFEKENIYIYEDGYVKVVTNGNLKYYFVDIK